MKRNGYCDSHIEERMIERIKKCYMIRDKVYDWYVIVVLNIDDWIFGYGKSMMFLHVYDKNVI